MAESEHGAFGPYTNFADHTYDLGGAYVCTRRRNVVVDVDWRGANYPPGADVLDPLKGTDLPYEQARQDAVTMLAKL